MVRLYADEGFPTEIVRTLRRLGHDVLTVQEAGREGRPDEDVLAYATAQGRAVMTRNRKDFVALDRSGIVHAGIVACTEDADWDGQARRVDAAVSANVDLAGKLLRVYKPSK